MDIDNSVETVNYLTVAGIHIGDHVAVTYRRSYGFHQVGVLSGEVTAIWGQGPKFAVRQNEISEPLVLDLEQVTDPILAVTKLGGASTPSSAIGWSPAAEHFKAAREAAQGAEALWEKSWARADAKLVAAVERANDDEVTRLAALRLRDEYGPELLAKLNVAIQALITEGEK